MKDTPETIGTRPSPTLIRYLEKEVTYLFLVYQTAVTSDECSSADHFPHTIKQL